MIRASRALRSTGRSGGFTLTELIVVIVMLGVLAAVAMPRFNTFSQGDAASLGTFDQAIGSVRYAQKIAVASRRDVRVNIAGNVLALCFDTGCAQPVVDPMRGAAMTLTVGADLAIAGPSFVFDALGRPTPGPVTVTITGAGSSRSFVVEAETGHVHP